MRSKALVGLISAILVLVICDVVSAQRRPRLSGGPGSTVQGDILRGQGQFLEGAAWYEIESAKAAAINAETAKKIEDWNRQLYNDYLQERAAHLQYKRKMTKAQAEAAQKKYEETQARLRTNPTSDEIIKGDALNALMVDLSDPSISSSSWRLAKVALPPDLSIPSLVFRFAPKPGAKDSQALGRGVIALARLDTIKGNRWGTVMSMDALEPERKAYEAAYGKVRDQCLAGKLSLDAPIGLTQAIAGLRAKVGKVVPTDNGYRTAATRDVDGLRDAAQIFHAETIDYAREMIADTQRHDAKTVGELLAFMRKYRLLFASVEKTLGGGEMYARLYGLMREQKEKLLGKAVATAVIEERRTWKGEKTIFEKVDAGQWREIMNNTRVFKMKETESTAEYVEMKGPTGATIRLHADRAMLSQAGKSATWTILDRGKWVTEESLVSKLRRVRSIAGNLKFTEAQADHKKRRDEVIAMLNEAIKDAEKGGYPVDNIRTAGQQLRSLVKLPGPAPKKAMQTGADVLEAILKKGE